MVGIGGSAWQWVALLGIITTMAIIDLRVTHKEAHEVNTKEAAIESGAAAGWRSLGSSGRGSPGWRSSNGPIGSSICSERSCATRQAS